MKRVQLKFLIEAILWAVVSPIALALVTGFHFEDIRKGYIYLSVVMLPLKVYFIYFYGLYKQSWRNVGIRDLAAIIRATSLFSIIYLITVMFVYFGTERMYAVPFIEAILFIFLASSMRIMMRLYNEKWEIKVKSVPSSKKILIVGAGYTGNMLAKEILRHPESGYAPIGFVDDDPVKIGQKSSGLPVFGSLDMLPEVVKREYADEVMIAMPSASGQEVRRVVDLCIKIGIDYYTMPAYHDMAAKKFNISQIRSVKITDLLRRKPITLNTKEISEYLEGKTVIVTGAGGSIGSEIVRQVANFKPKKLIGVGRGENSIYHLNKEIRYYFNNLDFTPVITDVRDEESVRSLFEQHKPDVVFHAAAHKHVPLMEANPEQAIKNNVVSARSLVKLALEYDVSHFVNVSTDKAVNPTSVMGASKRVTEYCVEWAATKARPGQIFCSVRFGNVLGSRGSVIPLFKDQIAKGGPVTVTHEEMTRYFMTIPEASQLVLQAGGLNQNGAVFVLDMGQPVKIIDLANDLIRLSGLEPGKDIQVNVTGIRPGEKLYEELLTAEEGTSATQHKKIFMAKKEGLPFEDFDNKIDALVSLAVPGNGMAIRDGLQQLIPSYTYKVEGRKEVNS